LHAHFDKIADLKQDELRWVQRAAVLSWFDAAVVGKPIDDDDLLDSDGWSHLLSQSEIVHTQGKERRRLTLGPRRSALQMLGTREAMADALSELSPDLRPTDRVQRVINRLLANDQFEMADLDLAELYGLETVLSWFEGILPHLPDGDLVLAARRHKEMLAPHETLAGHHFYGRQIEREKLRDYIKGNKDERLAIVHGPAGVGKSSLIASLILEYAKLPGFVFVDLDFGRPNIDSRSPETLLAEAARQIGAQVPGQLAEAGRVARDIERTIKPIEPEAAFLESVVITEQSNAIDAFVRYAQSALHEQNIPFILDTFEEAMALGETHSEAVLSLVAHLQRELPTLRPVLCSRVRPDQSAPWLDIRLAEMEKETAIEYLRIQCQRRGIVELSPLLVDRIVNRVNCTPLTLNIAAELLNQAQDQGRELDKEVAAITSKAGEVYLFDRLLKQINGEDAHKLAFPGLIVRRLEPRLVLEVLKVPCQLSIKTQADALRLLEVLSAKVSLIERRDDYIFVHRQDVRRLMLKDLIDNIQPAVIKAIDHAAVAYFLEIGDEEARAEAAYHLLRLGKIDEADSLLADPCVVKHLSLAVDEVNPAARVALCLRLGITPSKNDREAASVFLWERSARATATELLGRGDYEGALQVTQERPAVLDAELDRIAAEALVGLGRWLEAKATAERGLSLAKENGSGPMAVVFGLTLARIGFGQNDLEMAETALRDIENIESEAVPIDLRVHLAVARLRVARLRNDQSETRKAAELTAELVNRDMLGHIVPSTLRELTGELKYIGRVDFALAGSILVNALLRLGVEHEPGPVTDRLAAQLREASSGEQGWAESLAQVISTTAEAPPPAVQDGDDAWSLWLGSVSAIALGQLLAGTLKVVDGSVRDKLLTTIVNHMYQVARYARERKISAV